jgi:ubiquitin-protein ligase
VQPSVTNIFQWQVTMFPHAGPFRDRILTFAIVFDNFPAALPKIIFQEGILHPLIDPSTNRFYAGNRFPEWNVGIRVFSLINHVYDCFMEINVAENKSYPDNEIANLVRQGGDASFQMRALAALPDPPDPGEISEVNVPKRWGTQKERISHILVAIRSGT